MAESESGAAALHDEPVDAEILESDLVYSGRVWDVRSDTVRYGDGEIVRQYVDHPGAAAIVAVDQQDRVLLIQQYRHPIRHRDWEIPAGLLDIAGESPLETAKRELVEEADLTAADWEPLVSIFTTPGGNDEVVHLFLARGLSPVGTRPRARGRGGRHPRRVDPPAGCRHRRAEGRACATASWRSACSPQQNDCAAQDTDVQLERAVDAYLRHISIERGLSDHTVAAYRRDLAGYVALARRARHP